MNELPNHLGKAISDKHPQFNILCRAEKCLQKLDDFCKEENLSALLASQAEMYKKDLKKIMEYLISTDHNIVFIGEIGVGKTTAECFLMGLTMPKDTTKNTSPKKEAVLETGAGGTTVCEVIIQPGNKMGIRIEPQPDTEIYNLVTQFCAGLLLEETATKTHEGEKLPEKIGVSKEIDRVIRNMAGLIRKNRKGPDGKTFKTDPAKELITENDFSQDVPSGEDNNMRSEKFRSEVSSRLCLWERTEREIWYNGKSDVDSLKWLKDSFGKINKGMLKNFSLPRRIEVIVPPSFLQDHAYQLRLIDTKGIDGSPIRPDLQQWLENPRSLTVLCTTFMQAPDKNVRELLENLIEMGQEHLIKERLLLMVLPRSDEARQMKDDEGTVAKTDEEGYAEKESQVNEALKKFIRVNSGLPILFFNAHSDDPAPIFQKLVGRLEKMRLAYSERIESIIVTADQLIKKRDTEVQQKVIKALQAFLQQHRTVCDDMKPVHNDCVNKLKNFHHRTVYATVLRQGDWDNLDVYFELGSATRKEASRCSQKAVDNLKAVLQNMLGQEDFKPAHQFLEQLQFNLEDWQRDFLANSQEIGKETFRAVLHDAHVWKKCKNLWGAGSGFRQGVAKHLLDWFNSPEQACLHAQLKTRIQEAWDNCDLMKELEKLCKDTR